METSTLTAVNDVLTGKQSIKVGLDTTDVLILGLVLLGAIAFGMLLGKILVNAFKLN